MSLQARSSEYGSDDEGGGGREREGGGLYRADLARPELVSVIRTHDCAVQLARRYRERIFLCSTNYYNSLRNIDIMLRCRSVEYITNHAGACVREAAPKMEYTGVWARFPLQRGRRGAGGRKLQSNFVIYFNLARSRERRRRGGGGGLWHACGGGGAGNGNGEQLSSSVLAQRVAG